MPDITMPHSCELTIRRIDDAVARYADRLSVEEIRDLTRAAMALHRIATEDRARMADQT